MFNYDSTASTALKLIKNFGKVFVLKRTVTTFNAVTSKASEEVKSQFDIQGVKLPLPAKLGSSSLEQFLQEKLVKGQAGYILAAAEGNPSPPVIGDKIVVDDFDWEVFGVETLAPAGTPLIHKLYIHK